VRPPVRYAPPMKIETLLESLRRTPADEELRRVLADALLEAGDPRGELMGPQLDGQGVDGALLERCLSRVRSAAPGLKRVRLEGGLVTELELELADVPRVDRAWLAGEPLACITTGLPGEKDELGPALAAAAGTLGACRGFWITSRLQAETAPAVLELISEARPAVLGLDLGPDLDLAGRAPLWPSVEIAALSGPGTVAAAPLLSGSLPALRRLSLRGAEGNQSLTEALALEALAHLDLRGQALSDEEVGRLRGWLAARPGRSVRHERFGLGPPDLDDVFGARGLVWEPEPPLGARVAAAPGDELTFACSRGRMIQLHLRDTPTWRRQAAAPVSALAARAEDLVVGRSDGVIETWPLDGGGAVRVTELPGAIRSLSVAGDDIGATFDGGWWLSRGEQGGVEPAALALTATGVARADGTRVRISGAGERLVELGEPVLALAAEGEVVYAVAGRHVWRLAGAEPEVLGLRQRGRAVVAAREGCVAWTTSRSSAAFLRGAEHGNVTYPGSYSGGGDEELALADLAVAASGFVVTALEHGGLNLLGPDGAMKADEHPGEPHRRWIFIYDGSILIAE